MRRLALFLAALLLAVPLWGQAGSRDFEVADPDKITISSGATELNISGDQTVALWFKLESWPGSGDARTMYSRGNSSTWNVGIYFWGDTASSRSLFCQPKNTTPVARGGVDGDVQNDFSTGEWHFFACIVDVGGLITAHMDGSEFVWQSCDSGVPPNCDAPTTVDTASFNGVEIGNIVGTGFEFDGLLAYVHVYNRTLTQDELASLMVCPGSIRDGLVGYWPLLDSGTQYDQSTNSNNGTNSGTAASTDGPPVAHCSGGN